ncbi:MAG: ATP-binding protein [Candidatus Promineifilaceae bacterium]
MSAESAFEVVPAVQINQQPQTSVQARPMETGYAAVRRDPVTTLGNNQLNRFVPKELLNKLEEARSSGAMVGERRVVTILFCDVVGSTKAAEQLDPEDWTEIINGAFEYMITPVYQYEGTVARLTGDGILAFFGAPITHEDDPQRGVLAGLDIVSGIAEYRNKIKHDWNIDFNVRVGVNTGRVVVGAVGSDLKMEYTAMGDAINLAARMEQTADPGTVQVAEDTYRHVSPLFDFKELGGIEVKGKSDPVLAYRALRRKLTRGRLRGIEGLEIEMIGRERELASLSEKLASVRRGIGGIVCVIGDAGLGKSRLLREVRKKQTQVQDTTLDSKNGSPNLDTNDLLWIKTSSLSYETHQPYALFRRLIRHTNGINHNDPPELVREKLIPLVEGLPDVGETTASAVIEALFGLDIEGQGTRLEGEAFKRALFELMPIYWRHLLNGKQTVIVCDDLHWCDPASVALIEDLLPLTEELAVLFVCVFRPQRNVPGWQIKTIADQKYPHLYDEINLEPLSLSESNQMIDALLGHPELPDELRDRILERAEGNPFYIEEVIRTLIDGGALMPGERTNGHPTWQVATKSSEIIIPDNLQALLTARIDNLSEETRQTLQVASVIGRSFLRRVLQMIKEVSDQFDSNIQTLLRQELIRESARVPEIEYRFSNPLTQEAAYRTILLRRRRQFHLEVGEVMESLFAEHLEEQAPQLAFHFKEAQEYERAVKYFRKAGDMAYRLFANEEAVTHYGDALQMARLSKTPIDTDDLVYLYMKRGRALEHLVKSEEAMENYQAMLEQGQESGIPELRLEGMMAMATILTTQNAIQDLDRARILSEDALQLAAELHDKAAESKIYWNLLNTEAFGKADYDLGIAYGEKSLKLARELELKEQVAYTLNSMNMLYWKNNMLRQAMQTLNEVSDLWRELDNQPMLADSYSMIAFAHMMMGKYPEAMDMLGEVQRISTAINNTWNLNASSLFIGWCSLAEGDIDRGIDALTYVIEYGGSAGLYGNELLARSMIGNIYAIFGKDELARQYSEESIARIEEARHHDRAMIAAMVMLTYIQLGDMARAGEILEMQNKYDTLSVNDWFGAFIMASKALYALADNRPEEAIAALEEQVRRNRTSEVTAPLPNLLYYLGIAEKAHGDFQAAIDIFKSALDSSVTIGERIWRWQILAELRELSAQEGLVTTDEKEMWQKMEIESVDFISQHMEKSGLRSSFHARPSVASLLQSQI